MDALLPDADPFNSKVRCVELSPSRVALIRGKTMVTRTVSSPSKAILSSKISNMVHMTELLPPAEGGRVRKRAAGVKSSKAEEL